MEELPINLATEENPQNMRSGGKPPEELAEQIALEKLKKLEQAWERPYGERFFHHTFCMPNESCNMELWKHKFPENYYPEDFMKDSGEAFVEHGIVSRRTMNEIKLDKLNRAGITYGGNNLVSVFDDQMGGYYEDYGGATATFIIDPSIKEIIEPTKMDGDFNYQHEFGIEGAIPAKYILGVYISNDRYNYGTKEQPYGLRPINKKFVRALIEKMKTNPQSAFPILFGIYGSENSPLGRSALSNKPGIGKEINSQVIYPSKESQKFIED
jgi:hypothetical protein